MVFWYLFFVWFQKIGPETSSGRRGCHFAIPNPLLAEFGIYQSMCVSQEHIGTKGVVALL